MAAAVCLRETRLGNYFFVFSGAGASIRGGGMLERGWAAVLLLVVAMASGEHEYGWPGEDPEAVGVDLSMLEDGAGRPLTVDGSPAVAGSPAPWWFDGGLAAAPGGLG